LLTISLAGEQQLQAIRDAVDRRTEQRVPGGINRVLVERD